MELQVRSRARHARAPPFRASRGCHVGSGVGMVRRSCPVRHATSTSTGMCRSRTDDTCAANVTPLCMICARAQTTSGCARMKNTAL